MRDTSRRHGRLVIRDMGYTSLETCVTADEARANTSSGQREHFVGKREHIWQQREHIWGQTEHIRDQIEHLFSMSPVRTRGSGDGSRLVRRALWGRARTLREAAPAEVGDWGRRLAKRLSQRAGIGAGGWRSVRTGIWGTGFGRRSRVARLSAAMLAIRWRPASLSTGALREPCSDDNRLGDVRPPADSHQRGSGAPGRDVGRVDCVAYGYPRTPDRQRRRVHLHPGTRCRQARAAGGRRASERHRPCGGGHADAGVRLPGDGQPGAEHAGRDAGRRV